jgi:hypothetical protein
MLHTTLKMIANSRLFALRLEDVGIAPELFERLSREQQMAIRQIIHSVYDWSPIVTWFYTFVLVIANAFPILMGKHDPYDYLQSTLVVFVCICFIMYRERGHNREKIGYINDILACKEPAPSQESNL